MKTFLKLFSVILACLSHSVVCQLESVQVSAKLPQRLGHALASHDGSDSDVIYIFGGYCEECYPEYVSTIIYAYNATSDTITTVGSLPKGLNYGAVLSNLDHNSHYIFGGYDAYEASRSVYKFNATSGVTSEVGHLPMDVIQPASFIHENIAYILGGGYIPTHVLKFDTESLVLGDSIPFPVEVDQLVSFWDENNNLATFLGSRRPEAGVEQHVVTFNPTEDGVISSHANFSKISLPSRGVSVGGEYGYAIGGFEEPSDTILQYHLTSGEVRDIHVNNYVGGGGTDFWGAASAYVPELNRIYIFGGVSYNWNTSMSQFHDQIFYIDLTPLDAK